MNRSGLLDSVRGVAIIAVVSVHATGAVTLVAESAVGQPEQILLLSAASYGRYGVYLFFALSGWLIFSLYPREVEFQRREYWARRIARIWPLWLVFLALSLFLRGVLDAAGSGPFSWIVIGSWPLIAQFGLGALFLGWLYPPLSSTPPGGWSIQAEMGHYLLYPVVRRHGFRLLLASIVVSQLSYFAARGILVVAPDTVLAIVAQGWMQLGLYGTWPYFALGGALALGWRSVNGNWAGKGLSELRKDRILIFLAVIALFLFFTTPILMGTNIEAVGCILLFISLAISFNALGFAAKMLQSIGRVSYFIYFCHFFVIAIVGWVSGQWLGTVTNSPYVAWILVFLSTMTISWTLAQVSWRVFENPIIRFARRYRTSSPTV